MGPLAVVTCPRCGVENPAAAQFCGRCWGYLHGPTCPSCGRQSSRAGARYCEHCGKDLAASEPGMAPEALPVGETHAGPEAAAPLGTPIAEVPTAEAPAAEVRAAEAQAAGEPPVEEPVAEEPVIEKPVAEGPLVEIPSLEEVVPAEPVPEAQPAPAEPPPPHQPQKEGRPASRPGKAAPPGLPSWAVVALFVVAIAGALVVRQQTDVRGRDALAPPRAPVPSPQVGGTDQAQPAVAPSPVPVSPTPTPKPAVGILQIGTAPAGARVELDGTPVGITPLTLAEVKPGRHAVRVSRAGFRSVSREVEIADGERVILDLTLTPAPPPAPRRVRATPPPPPPPP